MNRDTKKLLLITIIAFLLAFCKSARANDLVPSAPLSELDDLSLYFDALSAANYWGIVGVDGYHVKMVEHLPYDWVGECDRVKRTISVKASYYKSLSYTEKMYVLVHEVGHCVLNYDHSPDPNNIMYGRTIDRRSQEKILNNMLKKVRRD